MTPNTLPANTGALGSAARRRKSLGYSLALVLSLVCGATSSYGQEATDEDDEIFELGPYIVEGSIRESLIEGLEIKKESFQMVDALVAEDIGKFPDNNVVEALQRVTGVQVTDRASGEVSSVSIRGLSDIATTVNGRNIFTSTGRSVALQDIPASLLYRVDVYKTRSAAEIEQGIAGVIDIKTQRPFYFDGEKTVVAVRGIYQELADSLDPNISALYTNTWELDNGAKFGALINLSYAETNYRDQSVTAGAMVPFWTDEQPDGYVPYQRIFDTAIWTPGLENGLPFDEGSTLTVNGEEYEYVLSRDAVFGNTLDGSRERPAANISLQYAPNEDAEYTFEAFYNGYRAETFNQLHFAFADWWGSLGDDPAANVELYPGTNIVKSRDNVGFPYGFQSGDYFNGKTDSYLYALGGKWNISDKFKLTADLSFQDSVYEGQFFAMRLDRVHSEIDVDFNSASGFPAWNFGEADDLNDPASWNVAQLWDNADKSEGDSMELLIDGDYNLKAGIIDGIKFGLRYDDRGAKFSDRYIDERLGYVPFLGANLADYPDLVYQSTGFFDGRSDLPDSYLVPNAYYTWENHEEVLGWYGLPGLDDPLYALETVFDVNEVTTSAYAVANFKTELGGKNLDGQFGLRYVNVDTDMSFYDSDAGAFTDASVSTDDILPSFTVRYDAADNFRIRFSYGETLRRPGFNDLNPIINYVDDVTGIGYGTASGGNPNLVATTSKNYDLAFEYYMENAGSLHATLFRRDIEGLVVSFRNRVTYEGYDYILSQPDNTSNGELEGVEIGWVYFPKDLPGVLDGFGVQAAYTMLDSIQDIPLTDATGTVIGTESSPFYGVSDSSYSAVLAYEKEKWSSRLSYVWREDWLNNAEAALFANPLGVWRKPQQSLDFQFTYNVSDDFKITLDATNVTDEEYKSYYVYPETHNFGNWLISRTVAIGARYSF
ncbi:TonB-dependent receptor [Pelagicoccus albus]|uniref:TonB-dependent receptor n=1 Tax=Pelagicoccus albus TaxID=415222 RepID=A0A7X1B7Y8_9BACT|nr:TonB-dependent receptor [Pelagicoccus albus]MBC2607343.1 TonB-dependent receptor [Pelagicoccus albus]